MRKLLEEHLVCSSHGWVAGVSFDISESWMPLSLTPSFLPFLNLKSVPFQNVCFSTLLRVLYNYFLISVTSCGKVHNQTSILFREVLENTTYSSAISSLLSCVIVNAIFTCEAMTEIRLIMLTCHLKFGSRFLRNLHVNLTFVFGRRRPWLLVILYMACKI